MRRKRHWYNQYNFLAPFINFYNWWKASYKSNRKIWDTIGYILAFVLLLLFIYIMAPSIVSEVYANKWDAEIKAELELKKAEQRALKVEQELRIKAQETEQRSITEWNKYQRLHNSQLAENSLYEKMAKAKYPIGTYISVEFDGEIWIGKIKSIHGQEITTTDGWHCYWGDDIQYSEVKEYNKFIKQNSKG